MNNILLLSFLLPMMASSAPSPANIHPSADASLCLDVAGGLTQNGTKVQIAKCNGSAAQVWTQKQGTLQVFGNKCLNVMDGNTTNFTQLQIWECGNYTDPFSQFAVSNNAIVWKGYNKCVDVPNNNATDGQLLKTFTCDAKDRAQQFTFSAVTHEPVAPVTTAPSAPSASSTPSVPSTPNGGRLYTMVNQCSQTVWVATQQNGGKPALSPSGFALKSGQSQSVSAPAQWGGRIWGRTGCTGSGNTANCESGDTGGLLDPKGIGGQPTSLFEITQDGWAGPSATQDYYDGSNVDGFNLPIGIYPVGGTGKCYAPVCKANLLPNCPTDLQVKNAAGKNVVCLSSCTKYQTDETCCRGAHGTSATCPAPEGAKYFKAACPDFYSYAYDDLSSTFVCAQPSGYKIVFCP